MKKSKARSLSTDARRTAPFREKSADHTTTPDRATRFVGAMKPATGIPRSVTATTSGSYRRRAFAAASAEREPPRRKPPSSHEALGGL